MIATATVERLIKIAATAGGMVTPAQTNVEHLRVVAGVLGMTFVLAVAAVSLPRSASLAAT